MVVDPWLETLLVSMDARGRLYFNSKEITSKDLPQALNTWFRQHSSSVVYFEADPNIIFAQAARVMNTIERSGGKVVLLTPKTRAESDPSRR
jgi:biopolymer transport protein ExbD